MEPANPSLPNPALPRPPYPYPWTQAQIDLVYSSGTQPNFQAIASEYRFKEDNPPTFEHADISNLDFNQKNMPNTDFFECTAVRAQFNDANLVNCIFDRANLVNAKFALANLAMTRFGHADLRGADLRCAKNMHKANFSTSIGVMSTRAYSWTMHMYRTEGELWVAAGCRHFSLETALEHWRKPRVEHTYQELNYHQHMLWAIDYLKRCMIDRGW